jgi:hypothetical protein
MNYLYYSRRFWGFSINDKCLIIKCIIMLNIINLLVWIVPLKYYHNLIKSQPKYLLEENKINKKIIIACKSLRRALFILPWKYNCFTKTITLKILLNSLGIKSTISLSILKINQSFLKAHASLNLSNNRYYLRNRSFHDLLTF